MKTYIAPTTECIPVNTAEELCAVSGLSDTLQSDITIDGDDEMFTRFISDMDEEIDVFYKDF